MSGVVGLKRLFAPKTIAVFGGGSAAVVMKQCRNIGTNAEIWPVNPNRRELDGVSCFNSVSDLPSAPDASFIAAPPEASIQIVRQLAAVNAGGAVCYASGFAELGDAGISLQNQLRKAAGKMPVVGPNCHGFINFLDRIALWPDNYGGQPADRGVALVTQSGNIGINLSMQQRGFEFSYIITVGNKSCIPLHDYINFLVEDERVTAIGLHIEGIDQADEFSIAAINALSASVPIVVIKTGSSKRGAELNMTHTASLSGEDRLYDAFFRRFGIVRCHQITQFLETLKFLSSIGTLSANSLGSMSCSGGEASLIADYADAVSLEMPDLSPDSRTELEQILGPMVPLSNPLDYHTYAWGDDNKLEKCFAAMLGNGFACTMLVLDYPPLPTHESADWEIAERALTRASEVTGECAVIVSTLPETMPANVRDRLRKAGITPMQGLENCIFAIRAATIIGRAQRDAEQVLPILGSRNIGKDSIVLDEWESKTQLAEAGIVIPVGRICDRPKVDACAQAIGYPVALKAISHELAHKTEQGAVVVNIRDAQALHSAIAAMPEHFSRFLVERMASPTVAELIVGISHDETFGLSLLVGAGGTLVELLDDATSLLLPLRRHEIEAAIRSLRVARIIESYRGSIGGDLQAAVDAVLLIAEYAVANNKEIIELDVNPLIVTPDGAVAVDAYIRKSAVDA